MTAARSAADPAGARYPGAPAPRFVTVRGAPLAVLDVPPKPDTPRRRTAVLVPGYTGSKEDFALLAPRLAAAGHRVVAVDQRGQYESPGPPDPAAYSVLALAADLLGLVAGLGDAPVHLLGHSFGGLVVRAAALERPAVAASVTLLGSGPAALTGPRVDRMDALAPLLRAGGMPAVYAAMEALEVGDPRARPVPAAVRPFLRARFLASSPAGLLGMGAAIRSEPDRVGELAAARLPVLVVYGEGDDAWAPAVQAEMARRLGTEHEIVADAAHSPAAEQPAATAAVLLAFWQRVEFSSRTTTCS